MKKEMRIAKYDRGLAQFSANRLFWPHDAQAENLCLPPFPARSISCAPCDGSRGRGQELCAPCTGSRGRGQEPFSECAITNGYVSWPKKVPDPALTLALPSQLATRNSQLQLFPNSQLFPHSQLLPAFP